MARASKGEHVVKLVVELGVARSCDFVKAGIHRQYVTTARRSGLIERLGRGTYSLPYRTDGYREQLAEACKRVPRGVICLFSALWLHGQLSEQPKFIWMAIDRKSRLPKVDSLPLRFVRFSGEALSQGVMNLAIGNTHVRAYSPMKTAADCFKYAHKIGVVVGNASLIAAILQNKYNRQKLLHFAEMCRVRKIATKAADVVESAIKTEAQQNEIRRGRVWDPETLRQEVWAEPLRVVARRHGVSDVALAKRCRKLGIPLPGRGYWSKMT